MEYQEALKLTIESINYEEWSSQLESAGNTKRTVKILTDDVKIWAEKVVAGEDPIAAFIAMKSRIPRSGRISKARIQNLADTMQKILEAAIQTVPEEDRVAVMTANLPSEVLNNPKTQEEMKKLQETGL